MSENTQDFGRPTKYNEEIQRKAEEYVNNFQDFGDVVPTIASLALYLDVAINTIYNWANDKNPDFLHVFNRLGLLQHKCLVNGGLAGGFNPAVTKMMLTKHGYSDRQEVDHQSSDGSMSPAPSRIEIVAGPIPKEDDDS